jgi:endoplasmic reticulum-Golgi intermediate compartment protein 3
MTIEFVDYRTMNVDTSIVVDKSRGEKLTVNMNITFPRVPCYCTLGLFFLRHVTKYSLVLSLDVMDISGETQRDMSHNVLKRRLNVTGNAGSATYSGDLRNEVDKQNEKKAGDVCGSCYGGTAPKSGCCNTCEEVRQAYINRGWSFSNPDGIQQVSGFIEYCLVYMLTDI